MLIRTRARARNRRVSPLVLYLSRPTVQAFMYGVSAGLAVGVVALLDVAGVF